MKHATIAVYDGLLVDYSKDSKTLFPEFNINRIISFTKKLNDYSPSNLHFFSVKKELDALDEILLKKFVSIFGSGFYFSIINFKSKNPDLKSYRQETFKVSDEIKKIKIRKPSKFQIIVLKNLFLN